MSRRRLTFLAALGAGLVLAVAAVVTAGGDAEPMLTHAQVVEETNGVCRELSEENLGLRPPPRPYDFQSTDFFDAVQENVDVARDRLGGLRAPSADAGALEALAGALGQISVKLEQASAAASVEQDPEVSAVIVEIREVVRDAIAAENELGACRGRLSTRTSIAAAIKRTRANPLTETGPLVP